MSNFTKKIEQINFGLMSPDDIREMSVVKIEAPDTYDEDGYPIEGGLMDPHLGVIDPSLKCRSCGYRGGECQGHFGSIELARPVIHVGFGDIIYKILRSTCNDCGRVLLSDEEIEEYTQKIKEAQHHGVSLNDLLKEIYTVARREECPHCGEKQGEITIDKPVSINQKLENGEDYKLTPSEVRERLERITDEDSFVLGVNPEVARPEWLVLTVLPVPPVTVRPSITLDTGERSEDDLTHKLVDILRINHRLIENMEAGAPQLIVEDLWELLQYHVTTYFDNEASGVPPARHRSGRPLKTLAQRLKGKEGRFRSNLSGKRVNFSARTVISPDPNISINEVGVPEMIAKEVTVPAYVNEWNIDEMREYIKNGPNVHPGANYVIRPDGRKIRVLDETKELILEQLDEFEQLPRDEKYSFIVERHLKDGDMVLFNRQPSLHRMSMMAHEVRVLPYKTFRLNLCVCPPYNADFDGDEMNMHVFQTDESRAEAKSLMRVQEHILSPRFGGPIIGAIHDHISGAYILTRTGTEFDKETAFQIIRKSHLNIEDAMEKIPALTGGTSVVTSISAENIEQNKGQEKKLDLKIKSKLTPIPPASVDFNVVVTDNEGTPLKDVVVTIGDEDGKTDKEGKCSFEIMEGSYNISVTKNDIEKSDKIEIDSDTNIINIKLNEIKSKVKVVVNVKDQNDKSVKGVNVTLGDVVVETNGRGNANFKDIIGGEYELTVDGEGIESYSESVIVSKDNDKIKVNVEKTDAPTPQVTVKVSVKDEDGKSVKKVDVALGDYIGETNTRGNCTFKKVSAGDYTLTVDGEGIESYSESVKVNKNNKEFNIVVSKVDTNETESEAPVNVKVSIKSRGKGVQKASVTVDGKTGKTGKAGGCTIKDVSAGEHDLIVVYKDEEVLSAKVNISKENNTIDIIKDKDNFSIVDATSDNDDVKEGGE